MSQKTCIIIHGCPSREDRAEEEATQVYAKHWIPWVKNELISKGIATETPLMPSPWAPDYENFKKEFEKYPLTKNSILIGHSCGASFLVRWLGETKKEIYKLILVAPWKIPRGEDEGRERFYGYPIDETIKSRVKEIIMFTSDNEEMDGKKSLEIFHKAFGGKIVELRNHGHFTLGDMGTEEFPELFQAVLV